MHSLNWSPHRFCLLNDPVLISFMNIGNLMIAFAYFLIPIAMGIIYLNRKGKVGKSTRMFLIGYGLFIVSCGTTHIMDIVTIYYPVYWAQTAVIWVTALVSVPVAVWTVRKIPAILE